MLHYSTDGLWVVNVKHEIGSHHINEDSLRFQEQRLLTTNIVLCSFVPCCSYEGEEWY